MILFLLAAVGQIAGAADTPATSQAKGFDAFALTKARNIFDPERRAMRVETSEAPPTTAPSRPDYLALTGTMVTPGKALAFFNGSRSEYNKVVPISEKLGDCTLVAIGGNQVELERKGKAVTLQIGQQITLDDAGTITTATVMEQHASTSDFRPSDDTRRTDDSRRRDDSRGSTSAAAPSTTVQPPAGAPAAPANSAELLRRMMERRQKEMSK
jgi:hypothetical protein